MHLPFGLGPRMCIGAKFALEEVVLALVGLYGRWAARAIALLGALALRACRAWRWAAAGARAEPPPLCSARRYTFRLDPGREQVPLKLRQGVTLAPADGVWVTVHSRA